MSTWNEAPYTVYIRFINMDGKEKTMYFSEPLTEETKAMSREAYVAACQAQCTSAVAFAVDVPIARPTDRKERRLALNAAIALLEDLMPNSKAWHLKGTGRDYAKRTLYRLRQELDSIKRPAQTELETETVKNGVVGICGSEDMEMTHHLPIGSKVRVSTMAGLNPVPAFEGTVTFNNPGSPYIIVNGFEYRKYEVKPVGLCPCSPCVASRSAILSKVGKGQ